MKLAPLTALAATGLVAAVAPAQTIIAIENFDGGTPTFTNTIASQIFVDPNSPDQGLFIQASSGANPNFSGNTVFGQDLAGEAGEPTADLSVFTFDNVDTSGFTDIVVSFDFAVFANADAGSFEVIVDGIGLGPVEFFNDPDAAIVTGTVSVPVGTASTVGLALSGGLNGASDTLELDNFTVTGVVPEPTSLTLLGLGGILLVNRRRGQIPPPRLDGTNQLRSRQGLPSFACLCAASPYLQR